jgi:peptide/nickel transport system ATP-binding protein
MTSKGPALELRDLRVTFDGQQGSEPVEAVKGVSLKVDAGERFGLVGESGSGKTTSALAIMGLLPPTATIAGDVLLNGASIMGHDEASWAKHRWTEVAMVFQGAMSSLNPVQSVGTQVAEPLVVHRDMDRRAAIGRAAELLDLVGIPKRRVGAYPHELSGGMRQRVAIAMALACEPRVLIADEPTTALDTMVQAQIFELLVRLSAEFAFALLLVTHDLPIVMHYCDRAAVMNLGEIVEQGTVENLFHNAVHPYTRALFAASPRLDEAPAARIAAPKPAGELMPGAIDPEVPVAELHEVVARFGTRRSLADRVRRRPTRTVEAVAGASLTISAGEMVALVGESGSGKTSTGHLALRLLDCAEGSVSFAGKDITRLSGRGMRRLRREMQLIYQDPYEALDSRCRVESILQEPLVVQSRGIGAKERRKRAEQALETVGLTPPQTFMRRFPHELSGGQRQRVAIAASLMLSPRFVVADEPVSMLDVSVRAGIMALLAGLRDSGMGILLITHDLPTAATYADRIGVMYLGRVVELGPAAEVIGSPSHPYTRALVNVTPRLDPRKRTTLEILGGEVPDAADVPQGCRFHPRCPLAFEACPHTDPALHPVIPGRVGVHDAACLLV